MKEQYSERIMLSCRIFGSLATSVGGLITTNSVLLCLAKVLQILGFVSRFAGAASVKRAYFDVLHQNAAELRLVLLRVVSECLPQNAHFRDNSDCFWHL